MPMVPLRFRIVILTMPLSIVQLSPLSVRVTGTLTVTLATFGASAARWADACCADAPEAAAPQAKTAAASRVEVVKTLDIRTLALVIALYLLHNPLKDCLS